MLPEKIMRDKLRAILLLDFRPACFPENVELKSLKISMRIYMLMVLALAIVAVAGAHGRLIRRRPETKKPRPAMPGAGCACAIHWRS